MERSTLILILSLVAAGCLLLVACIPSAGADSGEQSSRTVLYVSSSAGTWQGGVASDTSCIIALPDGRQDYRLCCPPGFAPVGNGPSGLACLSN